MALRSKFFALVAAGAVAVTPVAGLAQDFASNQMGQPAASMIENGIYTSIEAAKGDPAYINGAIFEGDPEFVPIEIATRSLRGNGINVAVVASYGDTVSLYFDGRKVNEWSQADFTRNQAKIELTIEHLKQKQQQAEATGIVRTIEVA